MPNTKDCLPTLSETCFFRHLLGGVSHRPLQRLWPLTPIHPSILPCMTVTMHSYKNCLQASSKHLGSKHTSSIPEACPQINVVIMSAGNTVSFVLCTCSATATLNLAKKRVHTREHKVCLPLKNATVKST